MFGTARIVLSCILLWLPFMLIATLSADSNNALILIFPFFGTIPALIMAGLVFSPIENFFEKQGMTLHKNIFVPVSGALSVVIWKLVMAVPYLLINGSGNEDTPVASWDGMEVWLGGGFAWGIIWLVAGGIVRWLGVKNDNV